MVPAGRARSCRSLPLLDYDNSIKTTWRGGTFSPGQHSLFPERKQERRKSLDHMSAVSKVGKEERQRQQHAHCSHHVASKSTLVSMDETSRCTPNTKLPPLGFTNLSIRARHGYVNVDQWACIVRSVGQFDFAMGLRSESFLFRCPLTC